MLYILLTTKQAKLNYRATLLEIHCLLKMTNLQSSIIVLTKTPIQTY